MKLVEDFYWWLYRGWHNSWSPKMLWRRTCWAWQRLTRGWDDTALWSIDIWLINHMTTMLPEFRKIVHGHPCMRTAEEVPMDCRMQYLTPDAERCNCMDLYLAEIGRGIELFKAATDDDRWYDEATEHYDLEGQEAATEEALDWLRKWVRALWD